MKLLSCYISAFGGLSDYSIDFSSDLTCILENNGFGKTTLAAFIKAMFYGMETANKRTATVESSERVRYFPWNNSKFGGHLTFSLGDKNYRIIRFFDRDSAARDSFQLVDADSGREVGDFSEKIGLEIFGVDEDGFKRSVFSNGEPCLDALPASVRSKISNIVDAADDFDDYEKALKKLTDLRKDLDSKNGAIANSDRKIEQAKIECERCKKDNKEFLRLSQKAQELEGQGKQIAAELSALNKKLELAAREEADAVRLEHYEKLKAQIADIEKENEALKQKYRGALPTDAQIIRLEELLKGYDEGALLLSGEISKLSKDEYKNLERLFSSSLPSEEELKEISEKLRDADICSNQLSELNKKAEALKNQLELSGVRLEKEVSDDDLIEIRLSASKTAAPLSKKISFTPLFVLTALVLVVGIAVCFVHLVAGIVVAAVGAVGLIAVMLLSSVKKMIGAGSLSEGERERVKAFLSDFGFAPDADVNLAVDRVKSALAVSKELSSVKSNIEAAKEQNDACLKEIDAFIGSYIPSFEDRTSAFDFLKTGVSRYVNEVLPAADKKRALEKEIKGAETEIRSILLSLGMENTADLKAVVSEIKEDSVKYKDTCLSLDKLKKEAEQSFVENKISEISVGDDFETTEQISLKKQGLEDILKTLNAELAQIRQNMQPLSNAKAELNELEELIDGERERREQHILRYNVVVKTIELLKSAKTELSKKYAGSISIAFERYSSLFFGDGAADFLMGADLSLTVNREGIGRAANQFSEGQRSVMDVCLRLSLIDAMFEKEKPFVVLDDSFSALDEENFKKAAELIKSISDEIQIVYFTCHSSRKI
ncbi:MAG: AAA family ATPase [Oscillospiraceae bacterium]|nr:AAA family ATPase [Oscillospiraceae bacterium]